jgi:hypothetical protein
MYIAVNACLLPDPVVNLHPLPFVDSQLGMVYMNHNCLMTPCIIGILDLYAKNYYFSSVLTLGVNKPESVRVSPELFEMIDYITTVSDFTDIDPLNMYQRLKKVEEPREGKSDELFSQKVSSPFRQGDSSHP